MESIRLRAVEPDDAGFMMEVENDMDAWIYSDTVAPFSHEQLLTYAMTYTADPRVDGQLRLILDRKRKPIGIVDLYDINERHSHAFIGIYIKPSERGHGYGRRGIELMADMARKYLNLDRIGAKIADINEGSLRFFRECGYRDCGSLPGWLKISGRYYDLRLLTLDLSEI